jgi:hypothetical protein
MRNGKYSLALKQDLGGKPVSRLYTVAAKWAPRFLHRPGRFVKLGRRFRERGQGQGTAERAQLTTNFGVLAFTERVCFATLSVTLPVARCSHGLPGRGEPQAPR